LGLIRAARRAGSRPTYFSSRSLRSSWGRCSWARRWARRSWSVRPSSSWASTSSTDAARGRLGDQRGWRGSVGQPPPVSPSTPLGKIRMRRSEGYITRTYRSVRSPRIAKCALCVIELRAANLPPQCSRFLARAGEHSTCPRSGLAMRSARRKRAPTYPFVSDHRPNANRRKRKVSPRRRLDRGATECSEWGNAKAAPEGMTTDAARKEDARSVSRWGGHASSRVFKSTHPPRPGRRPNGTSFTLKPRTSRRILPGPPGTTGSQALDAALARPYYEGQPGLQGVTLRIV
jgi:hypothetical protein